MKKALITILISGCLSSCSKEKRYCWQYTDCLGNDLGAECNKTQDEMEAFVKARSTSTCKWTYHKQ